MGQVSITNCQVHCKVLPVFRGTLREGWSGRFPSSVFLIPVSLHYIIGIIVAQTMEASLRRTGVRASCLCHVSVPATVS